MDYKHALNNNDQQRLDDLYQRLQKSSETYSGYPTNLNFDYSELYRFLDLGINNIGDPLEYSNYHVNTHELETEVIKFFAGLLHINSDYRGYVTSGGTEGNLYGLYLATSHYPDGIVYYSESSHYSIDKILRITKANSIKVPALDNGEIDYTILSEKLQDNKDKPAIFLLNIGTTMKGAVDNIDEIKNILNTLKITQHYFHSDAALFGSMLPFVDNPQPFDFAAGVDSIAISGHKFIGSPMPCGITIAKNKYLKNLSAKIAYVDIVDSTISGSRNGLTPLFMWYAIKRLGKDGLTDMVQHCLNLTKHVVKQCNDLSIPAWSNLNSNVVVFPSPSEAITKKWQIATYDSIAHFIIMPHHTPDFFDTLIKDLLLDGKP